MKTTDVYLLTGPVYVPRRGKKAAYNIPANSYVSATTGQQILSPTDAQNKLKSRYKLVAEITPEEYRAYKAKRLEDKRVAAAEATLARNNLYTDSLAEQQLSNLNFAPEGVRVGNALDSRLRSLNRNYLIASNKNPRSAAAKQYMARAYANELAAAYARARQYLPAADTTGLDSYLTNKSNTDRIARQAKFARWYSQEPAPIQEVPIQEVAGSLYGRRRRMY